MTNHRTVRLLTMVGSLAALWAMAAAPLKSI